jgi:predicted nucleic acid-binding protein
MIILDSSAWLEYFSGTENGRKFAEYAENPSISIVPAICIYEVYKKILKIKGENEADMAIGLMLLGQFYEIDETVSKFAAKLSIDLRLPMADSIIYAIAKITNSTLITQDSDFKDLDQVQYFPKD